MDPVTEYQNTLFASPDTTLPNAPPTMWPTNPNPYGNTNNGFISDDSDTEGESMETSASNGLPPLPQSFQTANSFTLPPIISHMAVDSTTTAPATHRPPHVGEGPSNLGSHDQRGEGLSPLFFYLGRTNWKGLQRALEKMRLQEGMESSVLFGKTIGHPPVPAFTGEPIEDTVPLLAARAVRKERRLYELERYRWKELVHQYFSLEVGMEGHARVIEKLRDQVKELQEDNVKFKKELETKGKKIDQLEEELKTKGATLEQYKRLTLDMGEKFMEWDSKMTGTFEALAKAASMGIDRPSSSS